MNIRLTPELERYFEHIYVGTDRDRFSHLLAAGVALALRIGVRPEILVAQTTLLIRLVAEGRPAEEIARLVPLAGVVSDGSQKTPH